MADTIPAGSRILAEDLAEWQEDINAAMVGVVKYKTALTSRTNNNTYTNDPHLNTIPVVANGVYTVELDVNFIIGAGGLDDQFTFPSGTAENSWFRYNNGTVTFTNAWQRQTVASTSPFPVQGIVAGAYSGCTYQRGFTLFVGATGGNLNWQWRQNVSNAAATTAYKGGYLRVIRVA